MKKYEQYCDTLSKLYCSQYKKDAEVKSLVFQVTDACQLRCTYCYQINKQEHYMDFNTAKKFIDYIFDNAHDPDFPINYENTIGLIIEFIGGEPLLAIDLMEKIMDYITQKMFDENSPWLTRHMFSISTNGIEYFDPKFQKLMKKYKDNFSVSVTVDGYKEMHDECRLFHSGEGSYDKAIAASLDAKRMHGQEATKITISPYNVDKVAKALIHMIELGYTYIFSNCVYEEGWEPQHATILYYQLKEIADYILEHNLYDELFMSIFDEEHCHPTPEDSLENWCGGTGKIFALHYSGDIYPCIRYMDSSLGDDQEPYIIGNVEKGLYYDKITCHRCKELKAVNRRTQSDDKCFYCPISQGCGLCSAYNYQYFGTVNKRATFICDTHKARALASAYLHLKAGLKDYTIDIPDEWALEIIPQTELDIIRALKEV